MQAVRTHSSSTARQRQAAAGGFNGSQLLHLAVAGCVSNDFVPRSRSTKPGADPCRRARRRRLRRYAGGVDWHSLLGRDRRQASEDELHSLVAYVDEIAEIPNSLRLGTDVTLDSAVVVGEL